MFEGLFQPMHLLLILVIVLIVFGAGKLPNVMGDLGRGVKEFKKAQSESDSSPAPAPATLNRVAAPGAPVAPQAEVVAPPSQPSLEPAARA
jgi:sec-independent protein translocase protein TatA